jgi:hypothetical protein
MIWRISNWAAVRGVGRHHEGATDLAKAATLGNGQAAFA